MLYGVAAVASIFATQVVELRLFEAVFTSRTTGARIPSSALIIFQFLLNTHSELMMVGLICAVMGAVVAGFVAYHVVLAAHNLTTNESVKRAEAAFFRDDAVRARAEDVAAAADRMLKNGEAADAAGAARAAEAAAPPVPPVPAHSYSTSIAANLLEVFRPASIYGRSAAWRAAFQPALPPPSLREEEAAAKHRAALPAAPPPGGGARKR